MQYGKQSLKTSLPAHDSYKIITLTPKEMTFLCSTFLQSYDIELVQTPHGSYTCSDCKYNAFLQLLVTCPCEVGV